MLKVNIRHYVKSKYTPLLCKYKVNIRHYVKVNIRHYVKSKYTPLCRM